jgi:hypothetical protein
MASKHEAFDDVAELRSDHHGVLGGDGAAFLEKVSTCVKPEGIVSRCSCTQCGRTNDVIVEWREAVIIANSLLPRDWEIDQKQGGIFDAFVACGCQYQLRVLFTVEEVKRLIGKALNQNVVNPQVIQQMDMQVKQQAASQGGRR